MHVSCIYLSILCAQHSTPYDNVGLDGEKVKKKKGWLDADIVDMICTTWAKQEQTSGVLCDQVLL